jgi:hypothetical protein
MHVFLLYKMQIFHFHFSKLDFCARRFLGTFVWYVWVCEEFSEFSTAMLDSNEFHGFWMFLYCRIVGSSKIRWFKIGKIYQNPLEQFPNRTRMDKTTSSWLVSGHAVARGGGGRRKATWLPVDTVPTPIGHLDQGAANGGTMVEVWKMPWKHVFFRVPAAIRVAKSDSNLWNCMKLNPNTPDGSEMYRLKGWRGNVCCDLCPGTWKTTSELATRSTWQGPSAFLWGPQLIALYRRYIKIL